MAINTTPAAGEAVPATTFPRRAALQAAPAVVAEAPATAPSFGERVMALSPERREVMMAALDDAERAEAGGISARAETVSQIYLSWLASVEAVEREAEDTGVCDGAAYDAYRAIEDRLIATPATTLRELAIKIVVTEDAGGEIAAGGETGEKLVAEARAIVTAAPSAPASAYDAA